MPLTINQSINQLKHFTKNRLTKIAAEDIINHLEHITSISNTVVDEITKRFNIWLDSNHFSEKVGNISIGLTRFNDAIYNAVISIGVVCPKNLYDPILYPMSDSVLVTSENREDEPTEKITPENRIVLSDRTHWDINTLAHWIREGGTSPEGFINPFNRQPFNKRDTAAIKKLASKKSINLIPQKTPRTGLDLDLLLPAIRQFLSENNRQQNTSRTSTGTTHYIVMSRGLFSRNQTTQSVPARSDSTVLLPNRNIAITNTENSPNRHSIIPS